MATKQQQQDFLNKIGPMAQADMAKTQILASLTIAQAILESGWGLSGLTQASNNLFGIKGSYNGQSVLYPTKEWDGSKYIEISDQFKKYPSWAESLADHSSLFLRLDRYHNLIGVTDPATACRLVQADGYATAPTYADSLLNLINSYDLTRYDVPQDELPTTPSPSSTYTVKAGDSWWRIAQQQMGSGSKMYELAEANGKTISSVIHPGDVLVVPKSGGSSAPAPSGKTYTVQAGDSWWKIAAEQLGAGSKMYTLAAVNGKTIESVIHPGDVLVLPE